MKRKEKGGCLFDLAWRLASRQSNAAVQVQAAPARLSRMFFLT
jgi:hypothetical protein